MLEQVEITLQQIPLSLLRESPFNPRRHFGDMTGLIGSVRSQGVLTPLLARPQDGGTFEVAAGHRRLRAAAEAGLDSVPVVIRPMDDAKFLEVMTIENLQREDVHPLEEGFGYRTFMQHTDCDVDALAERIGKSRRYVYDRLKLAELTEELQTAFLDRRITVSHAIEISRLPEAKQGAALEACFEETWDREHDEPMSVEQLKDWIREEQSRNLTEAPFDLEDEQLVETVGVCEGCLRPGGARPMRDGDVEVLLCHDTACYDAKLQAHIERRSRAGLIAISTAYYQRDAPAGVLVAAEYSLLEQPDPDPDPDDPPVIESCGFAVRAVIAHGHRDQGKEVMVCRDPACPVHGKPQDAVDSDSKWKREREAAEAKRKQQVAVRRQALATIVGGSWKGAISEELAGWMVKNELSSYISVDRLRELNRIVPFESKKGKANAEDLKSALERAAKDWPAERLAAVLVYFMLDGYVEHSQYHTGTDVLAVVAKGRGVDLKAIERELKAAEKLGQANAKAANAAPAAKKKGKAQPKRDPAPAAAPRRVWPEHRFGVYSEDDCIDYIEPTGLDAQIHVVECEDGFRASGVIKLTGRSISGLPGVHDTPHPTQETAIALEAVRLLAWLERSSGKGKKAASENAKLRPWLEAYAAKAVQQVWHAGDQVNWDRDGKVVCGTVIGDPATGEPETQLIKGRTGIRLAVNRERNPEYPAEKAWKDPANLRAGWPEA